MIGERITGGMQTIAGHADRASRSPWVRWGTIAAAFTAISAVAVYKQKIDGAYAKYSADSAHLALLDSNFDERVLLDSLVRWHYQDRAKIDSMDAAQRDRTIQFLCRNVTRPTLACQGMTGGRGQ